MEILKIINYVMPYYNIERIIISTIKSIYKIMTIDKLNMHVIS